MPKSRRPAILAHFPKLWWPKADPVDSVDPLKFDPVLYGPFPAELFHEYDADLHVLRKHLLPQYVTEDRDALRSQNEFRRDQVILIIGGVIVTGLAALPGAVTGNPGEGDTVRVIAALAAAALAAWASRSRDLASQERWRTSRLKAELLRGEYFLYLGRAKPYDVEGCRNRNLMRRVAEIRSGGAA